MGKIILQITVFFQHKAKNVSAGKSILWGLHN